MNLYYMRDNHTFRALPLNIEGALSAIREEFGDGYTHGSLMCKDVPNGYLHAHGDLKEFETKVVDFYAANVTEQNA